MFQLKNLERKKYDKKMKTKNTLWRCHGQRNRKKFQIFIFTGRLYILVTTTMSIASFILLGHFIYQHTLHRRLKISILNTTMGHKLPLYEYSSLYNNFYLGTEKTGSIQEWKKLKLYFHLKKIRVFFYQILITHSLIFLKHVKWIRPVKDHNSNQI